MSKIRNRLMRNMPVILVMIFLPAWAFAESGQTRLEIDHLLTYIKSSGCTFIRNGREYDPESAVRHIEDKYNHFKQRIDSAERFIDLCATRSTVSNRSYRISCPGMPVIESREWLLRELNRFRRNENF